MSAGANNKILIYYNPYSGSGVFKNNLDYIIGRCQDAGYQAVPIRASKGKVIDRTFAEINQEEYSRIIVGGGDGTVNLCVNAMIKHDINLPLAILPSGTANDFAYYFGLPSDIKELMDIALGDVTSPADVGKVNDKVFINVAAMGALVDVSQKTDPNLKNSLGIVAYYLTAMSELPQIRPLAVKLTTPDAVYEEEIYFMVVMNGESAGGFRKLNPESSINDGKLDVIAFLKMPIVELAPLLIEVLRGRHPKNKHVLYFQTDKLTMESNADIGTDIDGEHGEKLPLHFSVLHNRLSIFVKGD
ncbi:MAG: YegS/Rv2252/BmrU family lipid kinase [Clostridiales bacterium]|nr:YegS/Rv2252/BmrU family lipid kinase [Clostridiales bacterium]MDD6540535.1 YegS/Rv2252/BmrU family lipid kinase [Bacillota bacterium]MDY4960131.1 YegS/Rv2252/BmrU family lipid kinase [Lentihominibacter sp.]